MAAAIALLDTLLAPSTNGADKVYRQLKDILNIAAMQQAESSPQWWAEFSISNPGRSNANRPRTATELPTVGTTSSPA
jgi:hypothetical protein